MEKNTTVTHVMPTQTQVVTQQPGQTRTPPVIRLTTPHRLEKFVSGALGEIIIRIFGLVSGYNEFNFVSASLRTLIIL